MKYTLNCVSWNSLKEIFHSVSSHWKTQTTILDKLPEQKQERNDQQHAISPCESDFLQLQEYKDWSSSKTIHATAFKNTNGLILFGKI